MDFFYMRFAFLWIFHINLHTTVCCLRWGTKRYFYAAERRRSASKCVIFWYFYSRYVIHFASLCANKNESAWDYFLFASSIGEEKGSKSLNQWMWIRFFGRQTIKAHLYSIRISLKIVFVRNFNSSFRNWKVIKWN